MQSTATRCSCIFYQFWAFEMKLMKGETSKPFFPCRYHCLQDRTNRTAAEEKWMFNKVAVPAVKNRTIALKPFYLWLLQVVLGGSVLSHSDWQLIRCRGLEVRASSHFIYGSFLWQNGAISLSFPQAGDVSCCLTIGGKALPVLSTTWFMVLIRVWYSWKLVFKPV